MEADIDLGTDLLFAGEEGETGGPEPVEEDMDLEGVGRLTLRSVSRLHRHTLAHTGLMLWDCAPALCSFIVQQPSIFSGESNACLGPCIPLRGAFRDFDRVDPCTCVDKLRMCPQAEECWR